jgi:hypothetical protein
MSKVAVYVRVSTVGQKKSAKLTPFPGGASNDRFWKSGIYVALGILSKAECQLTGRSVVRHFCQTRRRKTRRGRQFGGL